MRYLCILLAALSAQAFDWASVASLSLPTGQVASVAIDGVDVWARPYDAKVEYLESDGACYIDTGVCADNTTTISVYSYFTSSSAGCIYGCIHAVSETTRFQAHKVSTGYVNVYTDTRTQAMSFTGLTTGWHTFTLNGPAGTFTLDSTTQTRALNAFTQGYPVYLLARNIANDNSGVYSVDQIMSSGTRIASCQIYQSGTIVRDFQPVRKDGVGYLFDNVTRTLFGNAGSGALGYGPDL